MRAWVRGRFFACSSPASRAALRQMNTDSTPLVLEAPQDAPRPTGDPWEISRAKPASVPAPLPVIMVRVEGSYTALDRKLWLLLLHHAWDNLGIVGHVHEARVSDVLRLFRQFGRRDLGQKGVVESSKRGDEQGEAAAIWQSVRRLVKTTVDWEDEEYQGISGLLSSAMTNKKYRDSGKIYYSFDPQLARNVLLPRSFARLRVHFVMGLRSKYAITLYEILEGYVNRREPTAIVSMDDLRDWLKVPQDAYKTWKDLKRNVVDIAVGEINSRADDAGFSIGYECIREGKAFTKIQFSVEKTHGRQERDAHLGKKAKVQKRRVRAEAGLADPENPPMPSGVALEKFRGTWPGFDPYEVINRFQDKWRAEGHAVIRSPDGAFLKFAEGMFRTQAAKVRKANNRAPSLPRFF